MTKQEFEALVARGPVLLDGAMGSNLLERGMPKGALSELWADRHPETVLELQTAYAAAGSRILYAPTFQAQPEALAQAGWTGDVGALNARLVALTRRAAGADTLVAGDLATMAGCLESWNPENFHRMTDRYRRQIGGLLEGGADLLVAETLLYPQEAEAVLLAAELEQLTARSAAMQAKLAEAKQAEEDTARELAAAQYELETAEAQRRQAEDEVLRLETVRSAAALSGGERGEPHRRAGEPGGPAGGQ